MQSRREYLVSKGLAKPGRGKFSNAAKVELSRAMSSGMKFSDDGNRSLTKNRTGQNSVPESKPKAIPASNPGDTAYIFPSDYRFPEAEYVAVGPDGKRYTLRECCNTCMVSLTNHGCNTPTIHNNIPVHIRPVKR